MPIQPEKKKSKISTMENKEAEGEEYQDGIAIIFPLLSAEREQAISEFGKKLRGGSCNSWADVGRDIFGFEVGDCGG
jgi:hypothetical protein